MTTAEYGNYIITAKFLGDKPAPWDKLENNYNNHKVTVKHKQTRASTSFEYWASLANPAELQSRSDLLGAFECFLSDALSGKLSFGDFCSEFGYDTDSRKAEQVYKACQRAAKKANRVIDSGDDIYKLSDALREAA